MFPFTSFSHLLSYHRGEIVSADDVLPMLLYAIIHCPFLYYHSSLYAMNHFIFCDIMDSSLGFSTSITHFFSSLQVIIYLPLPVPLSFFVVGSSLRPLERKSLPLSISHNLQNQMKGYLILSTPLPHLLLSVSCFTHMRKTLVCSLLLRSKKHFPSHPTFIFLLPLNQIQT